MRKARPYPTRASRLLRAVAALVPLSACLFSAVASAAGYSLLFGGTGSNDVDRVKIRVDDPATTLPGPPADVGATDFTLEFWVKASAADNPAPAVACGADLSWINGNIVIDRDRFNQDRKFGVSIAGGRIAFGVSGNGTGNRTRCGATSVLDSQWHHIAVARRASDGFMWIYVDGSLDASGDGPDGDVSYPDNGVPGNFCGGPCTNSDPFLVIGAEKHDAGAAFPSYRGLFDELRVSRVLRYTANFTRPRAPFFADASTAALYHFDEGSGTVANDVSGSAGGPSHGVIRRTAPASAPTWSMDSPFNVGSIVTDATVVRTTIATGLDRPVDIVVAPGDTTRLFVVEQPGRVRILRDALVVPTPFLDVTSKTIGTGESGLLGLAFHPDYENNRRLFVFYTRNSDGALVIERYERSIDHPEQTDFASGRILLTIPHPGATNHNGGKLAFRADGYLYVGTGDGGGGNDPFLPPVGNGQTAGVRLGKMLRIDVNVESPPYYAIPPSNPYAGLVCDGVGGGSCPEIWALGLRNPFRFSFDRHTGDMYIGDVGQDSREEIDLEPFGTPGGRNFGWKILEGLICRPGQANCTPPPNYLPPIFDYPRNQGVSVTGGFRYRGSRIAPLNGAYLYADFGSANLWAATSDGAGGWTPQQLLLVTAGISTFGEDHAGELYISAYFNGTVYRLDPFDTDADRMPDWWELAWFGSATAASPTADADGDGASNLAEYLAGTDPLNAQSMPPVSPFAAPEITSPSALVCVVGSPCALTITATGTPPATISRTGTLPGGVNYNTTTRTFSGTPAAGTTGTWNQSLTATNGTLPNATQTFALVVAANCGGFTDVLVGDSYCNSAEWLRNRSISLGCIGTQFCPGDLVARGTMALFQHRLGMAISPRLDFTEASGGALVLDAEPVVCATADIPPVSYPRTVEAIYAVSGQTTGAVTIGVTLVASRNGGATWEPVTMMRMREQTANAAWRSTSGQGVTQVNAGDAVRFGLALDREAGTANVNATRCRITTQTVNRDGIAPPRDTSALRP